MEHQACSEKRLLSSMAAGGGPFATLRPAVSFALFHGRRGRSFRLPFGPPLWSGDARTAPM